MTKLDNDRSDQGDTGTRDKTATDKTSTDKMSTGQNVSGTKCLTKQFVYGTTAKTVGTKCLKSKNVKS